MTDAERAVVEQIARIAYEASGFTEHAVNCEAHTVDLPCTCGAYQRLLRVRAILAAATKLLGPRAW